MGVSRVADGGAERMLIMTELVMLLIMNKGARS